MNFFNRLQKNPKFFKRFTGLSKEQFNHLAGKLGVIWECDEQKRLLKKKRKRKIGGGMNYKIEGIRGKLFAVLLYYRLYTTQELIGFIFGLDQSNISRLISRMTPLLVEAADPLLHSVLETRQEGSKIKSLQQIFLLYPDIKQVLIDGTESPTQRPKNKQECKDYFSGKKKRHTMKHQIICTSNQRILHVSSTYQGKIHDKTICDIEKMIEKIPEKISILLDLGYNGLQKEYPNRCIVIPPKKPRGGFLTPVKKLIKKLINQRRVVIEHAIGGVKRFNIVRQIFRGRKNSFSKIFQAACALHNFKLNINGNVI